MFRVSEFPINAYLEKLEDDYRRDGLKAEFETYTYNAEFVPLLRSTTQPQVNATDQDAGFVCFAQMQHCVDTPSLTRVPYPNVLVSIRMDAGGRDMQNTPTALINIFGTGERKFELPRPFLVGPKSSWTTTCTTLETLNDFNLRLSYHGCKVYLKPLG